MLTLEERVEVIRQGLQELLESYLDFCKRRHGISGGDYVHDALLVVIDKYLIGQGKDDGELAVAVAGIIGELAAFQAAVLTSPVLDPSESDMAILRVKVISRAADWYMALAYGGNAELPNFIRDGLVIQLFELLTSLSADEE